MCQHNLVVDVSLFALYMIVCILLLSILLLDRTREYLWMLCHCDDESIEDFSIYDWGASRFHSISSIIYFMKFNWWLFMCLLTVDHSRKRYADFEDSIDRFFFCFLFKPLEKICQIGQPFPLSFLLSCLLTTADFSVLSGELWDWTEIVYALKTQNSCENPLICSTRRSLCGENFF